MSHLVPGGLGTDPEPIKSLLIHSGVSAWRLTAMGKSRSITAGGAQSWLRSMVLNSFIIYLMVSSYTLKAFVAQMFHYPW